MNQILKKNESDHNFELNKQQMHQQFQIQIGMMNMAILNQYNLMNQNNKNEKPSEEIIKIKMFPFFRLCLECQCL